MRARAYAARPCTDQAADTTGVAGAEEDACAGPDTLEPFKHVADLITIFRTRSEVEASIVRGLLDSHGIPLVVASQLSKSIFPMAVNPLGETTISVHESDADEARRIIDSHRTEFSTGQLVR